jgi:hypothetical protein
MGDDGSSAEMRGNSSDAIEMESLVRYGVAVRGRGRRGVWERCVDFKRATITVVARFSKR